MSSARSQVLVLLLCPAVGLAQSPPPDRSDPRFWSPPPLVEAPADVPRAQEAGPATPAPPGSSSPPAGAVAPGSGAMSFSPYGAPPPRPGSEIGLMMTESLFGMLTAAGVVLPSYYLLLKQLEGTGSSVEVVNLMFLAVFSSVPLAVAQTEISLANGSRYYTSESWPAALGGFLAQAAVVGAYYYFRSQMPDGGEALLLVGTVAFVPIVEMVAINLAKTPRTRGGVGVGGLATYSPEEGLRPGVPLLQPLLSRSKQGVSAGIGVSLLSGRF